MNAVEIRTRWGLPDWTLPQDYPDKITDLEWRWEFLRRRPDYRQVWEETKSDAVTETYGEHKVQVTGEHGDWDSARLRFGVMFIYDPTSRMSDFVLSRAGVFCPLHGMDRARSAADTLRIMRSIYESKNYHQAFQESVSRKFDLASRGIVEYRFNLARPLEPQIKDARIDLRRMQKERYGDKATQRPSRELWPLYLRVLDARECRASWKTIGKTLWDSDTAKDKARRTYESAVGVRDNFPL